MERLEGSLPIGTVQSCQWRHGFGNVTSSISAASEVEPSDVGAHELKLATGAVLSREENPGQCRSRCQDCEGKQRQRRVHFVKDRLELGSSVFVLGLHGASVVR